MEPGYQLTSANLMLGLWVLGGLAVAIIVAIIVDSFLKKGNRTRRTSGARSNSLLDRFKRARHWQRTISKEMENRRWHKHRDHERDKRL
jgi:hypothetical protein